MRRPLRQLAMTLSAVALAGVCAAGELFDAPSRVDAAPEPVRVAYSSGVSSPGQPVVGRFGLFPPPPLEEPPGVLFGYDCLATEPAGKTPADERKAKEAELPEVEVHPPCVDPRACPRPTSTGDFSADAFFPEYDGCQEMVVYNGKQEVATQRPWLELGRPFYGPGPTPPSGELFGPTNLSMQKFYVYGDYRLGFAQNDLVLEENTVLAHRLNLELDYWLTATERFHAFVGPFQEQDRFMRVQDGRFFSELDLFNGDTDALFFEGDLGAMLGGLEHMYAPFDAPVTLGLIPLLYQNGVWALDTIVGGAVTIPAQNSPVLDWSNFDVTLFGGFDRITSDVFEGDDDAAQLIGATTFIESRGGYFELGYGYVDDQHSGRRSYHNVGLSYTRRYANLVSNSVRVIFNTGQDRGNFGPQTADGVLLLVENTFLTENPYNVLPYVNFFAGFDRPQPLARAGVFGGVLFNTGILFQSDALTGYPTLDPFANNTVGAAVGVDLLSAQFDQQLILEAAAVGVMGDRSERSVQGNQVGVGARWQKRLSTATLLRADAMIGLLDGSDDIHGARVEYRWKF